MTTDPPINIGRLLEGERGRGNWFKRGKHVLGRDPERTIFEVRIFYMCVCLSLTRAHAQLALRAICCRSWYPACSVSFFHTLMGWGNCLTSFHPDAAVLLISLLWLWPKLSWGLLRRTTGGTDTQSLTIQKFHWGNQIRFDRRFEMSTQIKWKPLYLRNIIANQLLS